MADDIDVANDVILRAAEERTAAIRASLLGDGQDEFSGVELARMVTNTERLADADVQIEKVYRKAWDMAQGGADRG